jgi:hypothetical protein
VRTSIERTNLLFVLFRPCAVRVARFSFHFEFGALQRLTFVIDPFVLLDFDNEHLQPSTSHPSCCLLFVACWQPIDIVMIMLVNSMPLVLN